MARISKKLGLVIGGCLIASALSVIAFHEAPNDLSGGGTAVHQDPSVPYGTSETPNPIRDPDTEQAPSLPTAPEDTQAVQETEPIGIRYPLTDHESAEAVFPLELSGGALLLSTPFSFDGPNPDANCVESKNIAAISITNLSGHHLVEAELILELENGSHIRFCAEQLPTGGKAMLFSTDNLELPPQEQWSMLHYRTVFTPVPSLLGSSLDVLVSGTQIQLTNTTDAAIPSFVLSCHDLLGEEYFGGKAYNYQVNQIAAGETVTIHAADSLLGMVDAAYAGQITE